MSILPPLLAMNTACWKYADIEGEWEVVLLGFWNVCICGGDSQHYNFVRILFLTKSLLSQHVL